MARTTNQIYGNSTADGRQAIKRKREFWGVDPIVSNVEEHQAFGNDDDVVDNSRMKKKWRSCFSKLDNAELFKDNSLSRGGHVKEAAEVLKVHKEETGRQPNVICRVESFDRMCQKFDERRRKWVMEMGFGGLLNLADMHLPRKLSYWLMTRIDP